MRHTKLSLLLLFSFNLAIGQINIVPEPVKISTQKSGAYKITAQTKLIVSPADVKIAAYINEYLKLHYGYVLKISNSQKDLGIKFINKALSTPLEKGYVFNVSKNGITITGQGEGLFYGANTLLQLFPKTKSNNSFPVPFCTIEDYPRFGYRGMHLDVGRHFMPVSFVKKYIDFLAFYKLNYLHWHLTEDQGWRIEIKKYPKLTSVGAWRNGTIIGHHPGKGNDQTKAGGYYTQEEIKDVVKYATSRFITIIPEIEMPGHSSAAIAAYPELSSFPDEPTKSYFPKEGTWQGTPTGKHVQQGWGVYNDVFCAGKESTFEFLQNVLDEVIALFPSKYIHIGGDECPKDNWKRSPLCQQKMKELGLKDEHELQSYFIQRIEKYLNKKGRTIIGWDEILEGGLAPNAIVMSWRGVKGGIEAAMQNHQVIMTPNSPFYFDHSQAKPEDSLTIGGYDPIEKVYAFDPIPKELPMDKVQYIWGAQANVWTEYMPSPSKVEYMIFPRISALSEVLWSKPENKNWNNFLSKLKTHTQLYDLWQVRYSNEYLKLYSKK